MWFTETWAKRDQPSFWATISGVVAVEDGLLICYHPMGRSGMCFRRYRDWIEEWRLLPPTRYEWLSNGPEFSEDSRSTV